MHRTDWAATFAGVEHRLLQTLSESPAWDGRGLELGHDGAKLLQSSEHDKTRLSRIGVAVDHSFDRGEDTARNTDHSMICWLLSQIPGRPHKALFELPGGRSTARKSCLLWNSFLFLLSGSTGLMVLPVMTSFKDGS